jgi:ribosomal protein L21
MFAVIKTGGKQYRVAAEDVIRIDRVNGQPGEIVEGKGGGKYVGRAAVRLLR